ncbi:LptF/LptG family permease [candidate division KSB1 bacterium]|nr:LptF/LptG family permease [candidate division KSB1 bacterium]
MRQFILPRYIFREHLGPFCFSFALITLAFLLEVLFRNLNRLLSKGLAWTVVLEFLGLNLAWIIATAVPMAVLTATLMAFGRLAADNEFAALQASGVSLWHQVQPVLVAAALLAVALIWFNDNLLPDYNLRVRTLAEEIVRHKPTVRIEPGVWYNEIPNYGLLAQALVDSAGQTTIRQLLIDDNSQTEVRRTISAHSGLIHSNNPQGELALTLFNGEIQEINITKGEEFRRISFSKHFMTLGGKTNVMTAGNAARRNNREKSTQQMRQEVKAARTEMAQLREHLAQLPAQESLRGLRDAKLAETKRLETVIRALLVEIHKKYAIPAACLVFVVIGAPLGTLVRRGGIAPGAGLSLGFFLFYWTALIGGEVLADHQILSPVFAMWFANMTTAVLGAFLFRQVSNGALGLPSFRFIALMPAIFAQMFWQRKRGKARPGEEAARADSGLSQLQKTKIAKMLRLIALGRKVKTNGNHDAITFDVVEPEFMHQWHAVPEARQLATPTSRHDAQALLETLFEFVARAQLDLALLSDRNGLVLASSAKPSLQLFEVDKLATLAAAQMTMAQSLGAALQEDGEFTCIFQEGARFQLFIYLMEQDFILTALAKKTTALGLVQIHANEAVTRLRTTLQDGRKKVLPDSGRDMRFAI